MFPTNMSGRCLLTPPSFYRPSRSFTLAILWSPLKNQRVRLFHSLSPSVFLPPPFLQCWSISPDWILLSLVSPEPPSVSLSPPAVFACRPEAQGQLVVATSAVERAVFLTRHWLASTRPAARALYSAAEELRCQVKRMGGFLQLLIQVGANPQSHTFPSLRSR